MAFRGKKARTNSAPAAETSRGGAKAGRGAAAGARMRPVPLCRMREEWVGTLARIPGAGLKGRFFPGTAPGTPMHNPRTVGSFLEWWVASKSEMGFSVRGQELIILRVGVLHGCDYVWRHHVPVALGFGVTEEGIAAVRATPLRTVFSKREAALPRLADERVERRTVRPEVWEDCVDVVCKQERIDMVAIDPPIRPVRPRQQQHAGSTGGTAGRHSIP